jgi:hypothetical protein
LQVASATPQPIAEPLSDGSASNTHTHTHTHRAACRQRTHKCRLEASVVTLWFAFSFRKLS